MTKYPFYALLLFRLMLPALGAEADLAETPIALTTDPAIIFHDILLSLDETPVSEHAFILAQMEKQIKQTPRDWDQLPDMMNLYSLGQMTIGNKVKGEQILKYVDKHYPSSNSEIIFEAVHPDCDKCSGKGTIKVLCPTCKGSGTRPSISPGRKACASCRGAGRILKSCHTCKSSGKKYSQERAKELYGKLLAAYKRAAEGENEASPVNAPGPFSVLNSGWRVVSSDADLTEISWKCDVVNNRHEDLTFDVEFVFYDAEGFDIGSDQDFGFQVKAGATSTCTGRTTLKPSVQQQIESFKVKVTKR